jgi:hypothetical protein
MFITNSYHVQFALINAAINRAKPGSRLYCLRVPHVADPSDNVVEVLIECIDWPSGIWSVDRASRQLKASLTSMGVLCTCWAC